jgi:2-keto-4-pentenoate hydratase
VSLLTPGERSDLAHSLVLAHRDRVAIAPLTDTTSFDDDDARAIATEIIARTGEQPIGIKLGFTSPAMRQQMGIDRPNYGVLTDRLDFSAERTLSIATLIHPRAEPEIALRLGGSLPANPTRGDVLAVAEAIYPAIEVVDSAFVDYRFKLLDNTADNSSAAGFVLGAPVIPQNLGDLAALGVVLECAGARLVGTAHAVMGHPLDAVIWAAHARAADGGRLGDGDLVLTGGLTSAPSLRAGAPVRADFGPLGIIELAVRP